MAGRLLRSVDQFLRGSLYLSVLDSVLTSAYRASANSRFIRCLKIRLGYARAPAWIAELYQLFSIAVAGVTVLVLPSIFFSANIYVFCLSAAITFLALYRLFEILIFTLHWVFIAKGPLQSYRRSLAAFLLNLVEVAAFYTIIRMFVAVSQEDLGNRWAVFYDNLVSVFTVSLPDSASKSLTDALLGHAQVMQALMLLLIVLAVVVGGITRGETDEGLAGA